MVGENMTFDELLAKDQSDEVYGYTWLRRSNVTKGIKEELTDHMKGYMYDERCETCTHWTLDVPSNQPPDGWGVYGFCSALTAINHKEHRTMHSGFCQFYQPICKKIGSYAISRYEGGNE